MSEQKQLKFGSLFVMLSDVLHILISAVAYA